MTSATVNTIGQQPQKKNFSENVTDSNGQSIPGTSVAVNGTSISVAIDQSCNFSLSVPNDVKMLTFSFMGMITQEIAEYYLNRT